MKPAFPKIFSLGTNYIQDIFKEEVEVTEKVDGSQRAATAGFPEWYKLELAKTSFEFIMESTT